MGDTLGMGCCELEGDDTTTATGKEVELLGVEAKSISYCENVTGLLCRIEVLERSTWLGDREAVLAAGEGGWLEF